jgi:hypothetical protein
MCGVQVGKMEAGDAGAAVGVGVGEVAGTSTGTAGEHGWTELTQFAGSNGPGLGRSAVAVSTPTHTAVRGAG